MRCFAAHQNSGVGWVGVYMPPPPYIRVFAAVTRGRKILATAHGGQISRYSTASERAQ